MKQNTRQPSWLWLGVLAALPVGVSQQAGAQDAREDTVIEEIVTTGTRAQERSISDSMVPIDVIPSEEIIQQGDTDLSNLIRNVVPSYSVNIQPISDAATVVRPAQLRGLAPDHTLVLVNGKRRHRAAVISWLGNGVADGAQGPDISTIPSIALKQVEVLRDGASAQYGSDAIAGVMNFILKDDSEGALIQAKYGSYYEGDGDSFSVAGNIGLPLGVDGFANLSFEYGESDPTDRSVQRDDAAALIAAGNTAVANPAQVWGSPEVEDEIKLWGNFGFEFANGMEGYSHANYASKTVEGGFFFRNPNTREAVFGFEEDSDGDGESDRQFLLIGDLLEAAGGAPGAANCPSVEADFDTGVIVDPVQQANLAAVLADPNCFHFQELFPGGFTPRFGGDVEDIGITAGVRGETDAGLLWDVSLSYGQHEVDFFIKNTVNASLGPETPTEFDPGLYKQTDLNFNVDVSYAVGSNANVAAGVEYRDEEFEIGIGQPESFEIAPLADQGFSSASNGFPGFSDIAAGSWSRDNIAAYLDMEIYVTDNWLVGVAGRYEDFEDFGETTNTKLATNYRFNENFAVRASLSSGFRAPTPGQSNAFNVTTEFDLVAQELVNRGTIPSISPVAQLRGGEALEPEESLNITLGVIASLGPVDLTVDYFDIDVTDRLSLSQDFSLTQAEIDALVAEGITSAANLQDFRFFTNDFDTNTSGIDVVATTSADVGPGTLDLNLALNFTDTEVEEFNPVTLDDTRIKELEEGLPDTRYNLTGNYYIGNFRFLGRLSYYDDWFDSEDGTTYDGEYLFDAEAAYTFNDQLTITLGAQNLFDTFPDENPIRGDVGNRYSQFTPFGFNGGFYYARLSYDFL